MDGVIERKVGENMILEIRNLSDDLKSKMKGQLIEICHGEYALTSGLRYHSYDETLKELVSYRIPTRRNGAIGAMGELLLNVLIREFTDMRIVSPFFNLEERSVKKGFDILAVDSNQELWIVESKAGILSPTLTTSTKKVCERLNVAKNDLDRRLNEDNSQLWLNAINSVRTALDDNSEKRTIVAILSENGNSIGSDDKNVVLGGTVFSVFSSVIDEVRLEELYQTILDSGAFSKLRLIAIQKATYQAIIDYLKSLIEET